MITLTPRAKLRLSIESSKVRLALRSGGCAGYSYNWSYDNPSQDDIVVDGLLIVDSTTADLLGDVTIDWVENLFESGWSISSERLSSCGCGSSVSLGGVHG